MIDLHLHTVASDGRCEPAELVRRAWTAGVRVLSVTDHDTVAALAEIAELARTYDIETFPGIEITAVDDARDVHVLAYFFDPRHSALVSFLQEQRADRVRRVQEMAAKLEELGKPIDVERLIRPAAAVTERSVGRPLVAGALVRAGHAADVWEAFATLIGEGQPAFVPRRGSSPASVVRIVHEAGGIASLAHPGLLGRDLSIPELAAHGLDALEVYHTDHDLGTTTRYLSLAAKHGLAVSGGSDYHGEDGHRRNSLGKVGLPEEHYRALRDRAASRRRTPVRDGLG